MASKEVKEIVKQEGTKTVPFWGEMEKGLNEFFRRPLSLFNLLGTTSGNRRVDSDCQPF